MTIDTAAIWERAPILRLRANELAGNIEAESPERFSQLLEQRRCVNELADYVHTLLYTLAEKEKELEDARIQNDRARDALATIYRMDFNVSVPRNIATTLNQIGKLIESVIPNISHTQAEAKHE